MTLLAIPALAMLVLGHLLRAMRQAALFPATTRPRTLHLTVGLSIGYVINAWIPFRVGELVRTFYVAARADQRFGQVAATVIVERLSDLAVVVVVLASLPAAGPEMFPHLAMAAVVVAAVLAAVLLQHSRHARALLWRIVSPFNDRLRLELADMAWTAAQLILAGKLLRPRYLLLSLAMWAAYLIAYALLGAAAGVDVATVATGLLGNPLAPLAHSQLLASALIVVTSLAALAILIFGLIADGSGIDRSIRKAVRFGLAPSDLPPALSVAAFARAEDYGATLQAHFADGDSTMARFGLHGLDGAVVQRLLPGGSDAITAVVAHGGTLAIRKFAVGDAGEKLADQARWLDAHAAELPLADVVARRHDGAKFHFDMPYLGSARDFYEMIHVLPIADSSAILTDVVDCVGRWHDSQALGDCTDTALAAYIDRKVIANARTALDFARLQLPDRYRVNGRDFRLDQWDCLLDPDWIAAQMPTRATTLLHGDLTIENIVLCPDRAPGWYLIDPNPGNLFDTPLIDWAKLMQSLNLGYEVLNRGPLATIRDGEVHVMLSRSRAYATLHDQLRNQLAERIGEDRLREVAFHEIVNYLRLIPYKLRRNPARAATFFAATTVLLDRYLRGCDD